MAIYCRHSSADLTGASSLEQAIACDNLVQEIGGAVIGTYIDLGYPGNRRDRPGLTKLVTDLRAGEIDVVIAEGLDRLSRGLKDINWLGGELENGRAHVHTVADGKILHFQLVRMGNGGMAF